MSKNELARQSVDDVDLFSYDKKSQQSHDITHDAVFGELSEDGPNYRNVWCILPSISYVG